MTNDHHNDEGPNITASLRAALRTRPEPPPAWNLDAIKARGRARRTRARLLPVAAGLAVVIGVGAGVAGASGSWPWRTPVTTTVAASTVSGHPEEVVRQWMHARLGGDIGGGYWDYWVPGTTDVIDTGAGALRAQDVSIGAATTRPPVWTRARSWPQAVQVPLSYGYDDGPGLTTGKYPFSGTVTLVRETDTDPWRIVASDDALQPALSDSPVLTVTGRDGQDREASGLVGTLAVDGGCLRMGSSPVVWPGGSVWDPAASQVVLPDRTRVGAGDRVLAWEQPVGDLTATLGPEQAAFVTSCGGVGVPVSTEPAVEGQAVHEVIRREN